MTVCHVVMSEIMTGVVPSQVIAPARAFARAFPHIPVRVVFLEAARVAIAPRTRRRLREIRKLWPEGRIDVSAYVGRMGEFAPSMALRRAVRLAGLDESVTGYTLRHTTASWLLQGGVSTAKTAAILGTSEAMIERHYGHLAPDHLRDEVAMIGRRVSGS